MITIMTSVMPTIMVMTMVVATAKNVLAMALTLAS